MAGIDPTTCNIRMAPALHWCWYLTLFTGLATFFLALLILFLDYFFPRIIAPVFHHNIVEDDEFFAVSPINVPHTHTRCVMRLQIFTVSL